MCFVANFIRFPVVQSFENRLRFKKVTESLKVGTFLRHSVYYSNNEISYRAGFCYQIICCISCVTCIELATDKHRLLFYALQGVYMG